MLETYNLNNRGKRFCESILDPFGVHGNDGIHFDVDLKCGYNSNDGAHRRCLCDRTSKYRGKGSFFQLINFQ